MSYLLTVSMTSPFFFIHTATTDIYTLSLHDALPISPHHDRGPPQLRKIEGVERLVQLEQDVVGGIDDVVDRALTHRREPVGEPGGARHHPYAAEHRDHVARGPLWILETHFHAINHTGGGLADRRSVYQSA